MKVRLLVSILFLSILLLGCDGSEQGKKPELEITENDSSNSPIEDSSKNTDFDLDKQKDAYQLTRFEVLDINESPYDSGPALAISFSVPLDMSKNIQDDLQVLDADNKQIDGAWVVNNTRTRAFFQYIEPSQQYRVLVDSSILSINAQQLAKDVKRVVQTSRLEDSVRFINKGHILPTKLTRGLPVESVNIEQVDINFHRVLEDRIPSVISQRLNGNYYYIREIPQYSELVYSARYTLDYAKNKKRTTILPIQQIKELQQPGFYIAVMKPAGEYPYEHQVTSFYLSNLALHVTNFNTANSNNIQVHSLTIEDGKALANVELTIVSQKGETITKASTDVDGNYQFSNIEEQAAIIGRINNDFAVISLTSPALDLSEQLSITRRQQDQELFLYGPRDLYRPGETVYVNGILRDHDGELLPSVPLEVKLVRPDGRVARAFSWHAESIGFYSKELSISKSDPTGEWTLEVTHPGNSKFQYAFSVEEFLPERMKLELTSQHNGFVEASTDIQISGQGDYLYGAPAANNKIAARITVKPNHFPLEALKDFYFGRVTKEEDIKDADLKDQNLDKQGATHWLLPNLWQKVQFPTQVVFEASLFESGGRPVTRRTRQNIWAGQSQIGLRPLYKEKIVTPFSLAEFELINANKDASLNTIGELEISLIREDTDYYWRRRSHGWDYGTTSKESRVYSRVLNEADDRTTIQLPVDYGRYRLEIRNTKGQLKNSYQFFAGWHWDGNGESGVAGARPDKVRIQFDQESYSAKQKAKITLISPHLGKAIVRVESDRVLWETQIDLTSLEQQFDLPISADWARHDLYLTVMVVSPSADSKDSNTSQLRQLPKRALGVQALILDRKDRRFTLNIESPEVVEPEQTINIQVSLAELSNQMRIGNKSKNQNQDNNQNQANNQDKIWVTLAAVDTGILSLSAYKTPDPFEWFYGQRAYQGNIRDSFSQLIKNQGGQLGVQKFGGDAELARGGEQPATDVQIVSIFSKLVQFDQDGKANIALELPDFNGELRLMAVAFSGSQFASQEQTMKVRAPLVAEMSLPRFLAKDDQTKIAFDLQNMSGEAKSLVANIQFSGAISAEKVVIEVALKDGEKHSKKIAIQASGLGEGEIVLQLVNAKGELQLTRSWKLNVRPAYPAEFVRHRKVLQKGNPFELSNAWIKNFDPDSLQAKLMLSSRPPLDSDSHLQGLLQYPYGCLEQTSSRAWPLLSYQSFSHPVKLDKHGQNILAERNKHIDAAIQRINGMQKSNGSFGLWSNQSPENHWLTVYALDFLLQAKKSGYSVPQSVLDKALKRIKSYLRSIHASYAERQHYSDNAKHYALAFRSYAAYLLSKNAQLTLGEIRQVETKLASFANSPLPLAHLAIAFENSGDNKTALKLWKKAINFKQFSTRYSGDYGSLLRDTAWLMMLATESQLNLEQQGLNYQDLIFTINDEMLNKRWFSTQERFSIYRLALALDNVSEPNWTAKITSSEKGEQLIQNKKGYSQWLSAQLFKQHTKLELTDGKNLFVDLQLVGYPLKAPKQVSNGISSEKHYYNLQGKKITLNKVKSGDYVLTRINVSSSKRLPDALLVDLLPAGFELENPGLEFSQDFSEVMIEDTKIYEWHHQSEILHTEYRDDRFVAAISLNQHQSTVIFYLMRAVNPGTYQVPPTQVEDMYRPYLRSLSAPMKPVIVLER